MFTGIVSNIAKVYSLEPVNNKQGVYRLILNLPSLEQADKDIILGESIAINGVCLTVVDIDIVNKTLAFDVSDETLSCTNFKELLNSPSFVNIERSLQLNSRLSGHLVTGHVDSVCTVVNIEKANNCYIYNFEVNQPDFLRYIAPKGSICLDGISLTVNGVIDNSFWVTIIPTMGRPQVPESGMLLISPPPRHLLH